MTEVPEHLLKRAAARRAAMSGEAPPADDAPAAAPAASASAAVEPAAAAPVPEAPKPVAKPEPTYVIAAKNRTRMPKYMVPVMAILPVWAFLYAAAIDPNVAQAEGPLAEGKKIYSANCGSCHGGGGEGGVGPAMSNGEVLLTFSKFEDHVAWIENGSTNVKGKPYGDADRPGGQKIATTGGMPAFAGQLTEEQIKLVVYYERVTFGGMEPDPELEAEIAAH